MDAPVHRRAESYWVPPYAAARITGRTYATIRRWAATGRVAARYHPETGQLEVWLWSALDASGSAQRRRTNRWRVAA